MMPVTRMRVYLQDEAPRIGCGWRIVQAMTGRKWVRIASVDGRGKLTKAVWASIARHGRELPPRIKRRKRRAKAVQL